ncbi:hypothetical protein Ctha_0925 [Chloroherpeton thalassium ATCC 35110]|uniref:Uncharacterized protein n=1 Tax=Chloroherpeton thalassium (strain ATCC 35110 / GB-78) TaxID=517418 RepID=B3QXB6_CHLT3|nr:hypothetical protein [Chloroherpeton thalassium]ACF13390.1 hypothetical protein Ctha_0925 [Chloroherpeton thalassium ATCC 35110]
MLFSISFWELSGWWEALLYHSNHDGMFWQCAFCFIAENDDHRNVSLNWKELLALLEMRKASPVEKLASD